MQAPARRRVARRRPLLGAASALVTLAALLGLALAALARPAVRAVAAGPLAPPLAVVVADSDGRIVGRRGARRDGGVPVEALPPHLVEAVLATEDRRFLHHAGIDPVGLVRAVMANAKAGRVVQGGSTITQQLAKILYLSGERTASRKIDEAFIALWLEWRFTKREILKLYLDHAYLGGGAHGVAAAAQAYFGKRVTDLDLAESALLAGLLKAPSGVSPRANPAASRARTDQVLANMLATGAIRPGEAEDASRRPAAILPASPDPGPGYYLDRVYAEVLDLVRAGRLAPGPDIVVRAALDPPVQAQAERSVADRLDRDGPRLAVGQAAVVVMDPDGALQAIVGGRDHAASAFDRAIDARRQPGSAFKPFVYAAALTYAGYRPDTIVEDRETWLADWSPENYGRRYAGALPLREALARSINTIPVQLSIAIGRAERGGDDEAAAEAGRMRIIGLAHRMGITSALADAPSLPLGASEVGLLDLTASYAVLANGGRRVAPHAVLEVRDAAGALLYRRAPEPPESGRALASGVVQDMNRMLAGVPEHGTGRRAALPGIRSAGKTGTTNAYRDAWYVGYTGERVAGIWFGNDDNSPMRGVTGGGLPAETWREVMSVAEAGAARRPIPYLESPLAIPAAQTAAAQAAATGVPGGFAVLTAPSGRLGGQGAASGFTVLR